jgi:hypothetical protein
MNLLDFIRIWRARGARNAACELHDYLAFDLRRGVDLATRLDLSDAGAADTVRPVYVPVYAAIVRTCLRRLARHIGSPAGYAGFGFVDIGSGKGKPVIVSQEFGFARSLGIEYVDRLIDAANANVRRLGLDARAGFIQADMTKLTGRDLLDAFGPTPPDGLVLFAYNPFDTALLADAIDAWRRDLAATVPTLFAVFVGDEDMCLPFPLVERVGFATDSTRTAKIYDLA